MNKKMKDELNDFIISKIQLQVNDIFNSISGEIGEFEQGTWCTFIRLQGCNLRCSWCDTKDSQRARQEMGNIMKMSISGIMRWPSLQKHIIITGGEPLFQDGTTLLASELIKKGHKVQIETNGSLPIPSIPGIDWVIDDKCPSSGQHERMNHLEEMCKDIDNVRRIGGNIYIKWVVKDMEDIEYAINRIGTMKEIISKYEDGDCGIKYAISPINGHGKLIPTIVEIIEKKNKKLLDDIIFSVQLHKLIEMP